MFNRHPWQEVGSSQPREPCSDNRGSITAGTALNCHLHAGHVYDHDHIQQSHARESRRRIIDPAKEKRNNQVAKRTGVNHGVDACFLQLTLQPKVPRNLTTGL